MKIQTEKYRAGDRRPASGGTFQSRWNDSMLDVWTLPPLPRERSTESGRNKISFEKLGGGNTVIARLWSLLHS
jgi:hypothetical protein